MFVLIATVLQISSCLSGASRAKYVRACVYLPSSIRASTGVTWSVGFSSSKLSSLVPAISCTSPYNPARLLYHRALGIRRTCYDTSLNKSTFTKAFIHLRISNSRINIALHAAWAKWLIPLSGSFFSPLACAVRWRRSAAR